MTKHLTKSEAYGFALHYELLILNYPISEGIYKSIILITTKIQMIFQINTILFWCLGFQNIYDILYSMEGRMQQKKGSNSFLFKTPVLIFCMVITILLLLSVVDVLGKMSLAIKNKNASEIEYERLKDRESKLTQTLSDLNTEKGIDATIRDHFPVTKDGEKVILVVDTPIQPSVSVDQSGFVSFLKKIFGRKTNTTPIHE